jgi:hypothetical protein
VTLAVAPVFRRTGKNGIVARGGQGLHVPRMKWYKLILPGVAVLLGGCATTATREAVAGKRTALFTAFDPVLCGHAVGTTVFQNHDFAWADTGFDPNAAAIEAARRGLSDEVVKIGRGEVLKLKDRPQDAAQLLSLADESRVDALGVLRAGSAADTIAGTSVPLRGVGLYERAFLGMKRLQVYAVLELDLYDAKTGRNIGRVSDLRAREVPSVAWHDDWAGYSAMEKRILLMGWRALFAEGIPQLLGRVGLSSVEPEKTSLGRRLLFTRDKPQSWLPEGNRLELPPGVTVAQAHAAVLRGLQDRGWSVVAQTENRIVGVYRDGEDEAGMEITITADHMILSSSAHKVTAAGTRVPAAPYTRWNRNLKASIYKALLQVEPAKTE